LGKEHPSLTSALNKESDSKVILIGVVFLLDFDYRIKKTGFYQEPVFCNQENLPKLYANHQEEVSSR